MKLPNITESIQRKVGAIPDKIWGIDTATRVAKALGISELEVNPLHGKTISARGLTIHVDGDDLVVKGCRCTCFGGTNDPQDSGDTASGVSTKPPKTLGCALPRNYTGSHRPTRLALEGSPIPEALPFKTLVEVTSAGKTIVVPFIDLGPNLKTTSNFLDLTVAAAKLFDPRASASNFEMICDYRILGGAKFL